MAPSAFLDRDTPPADPDLDEVLGRSRALWVQLLTDLASAFGPLAGKWSYSGASYGWAFQVKNRKRTIVYLVPGRSHFLASFAMGEKASKAAGSHPFPASVLEVIAAAPRYAEGRGVRLPVRTKTDLALVLELARIKMAH
jgi:hypothetical protein